MAELVTTDTQIEQYIIDLLKINTAVIAAGSSVNHTRDNSVQKADNLIDIDVVSSPIYPGLAYKKGTLQIGCGTRTLGYDESGAKLDTLKSSVYTVLNAIQKGDKSAYGFSVDGLIIRDPADAKDDTHIFKIVNAEIYFREITIVPATTTTTTTTH
jgi:hypothetical protein